MNLEMTPRAGPILAEGHVLNPSTQSAARPRLKRVSPESRFRPRRPRGAEGRSAWIFGMAPGAGPALLEGLVRGPSAQSTAQPRLGGVTSESRIPAHLPLPPAAPRGAEG